MRVRVYTVAVAAAAVFATVLAPAVKAAPAEPIASANITPSSVEAGSPLDIVITYVAGSSAFKGYAGSQIPTEWTPPQSTSPGAPGHVSAVAGSCKKVSFAGITGDGPWTVAVEAKCRAGESFSLRYSGVTAPSTVGSVRFESGSVVRGSPIIQPVSPAPTVDVVPGPVARLLVSGFPELTDAGQAASFNVQAYDRFDNARAIDDPISFSSSDPKATLPAATQVPAEGGTFSAVLRTAGEQSLTATVGEVTGTQPGIHVAAGPLARLDLSPENSTVDAGDTVTYTAQGRDEYGNSVDPGPVTLTIAPDGSCSDMACTTASPGTKRVTAQSNDVSGTATIVAGAQTITVQPDVLPPAYLGVPYHAQLSAQNALGGATFGLADGSLPSGLSLSADGLLSGTPSEEGERTFTIRATDGNGVTGERQYTLQPMPEVTASPSPTDFGSVAVGSTAEQVVTFTNNGPRSLSFHTVGVTGDWNFETFAGCFSTTLAPGESCTQQPRFAPTTTGPHTGNLYVRYTPAGSGASVQVDVALTGVGVPEVTASPSPADFGSVAVSSSSTRTVTFTNHGSRTLSFNTVGVTGDWNFETFAGCFGTTLAPGESCTQQPRFAPTTTGLRTGNLYLRYTPAGSGASVQVDVPLTGVGTPEVTASPSPADFGSVAVSSSSTRTVTFTNHGSRTLSFNTVGVTGDWNFETFAGCFGTTLAPGESCTQQPRFAPTTTGPRTGNLYVRYNATTAATTSVQVDVPLTGVGTPEVTASPSPADFGAVPVGTTSEQVVTFTNNGSRTLSFNTVGVTGDWNFETFAGCFGTTLAPGESCTQQPRFAPSSGGPHTGNLYVRYTPATAPTTTVQVDVPLRGYAFTELEPTPAWADFGSVAVTQTSPLTVTFTNRGTRTLSFNTVGVTGDWNFETFAGCFGTTLAPGESCTQQPRFAPTETGPRTGNLYLRYTAADDPSTTVQVDVPLSGVGIAEVTATPSPADFGSVPVGTTSEQVVTFTNNGSRTLSFNTVGVTGDWNFATFAGCFSTTLAPGESCTQQPRFAPTETGPRTGNLYVRYNAAGAPGNSVQVDVPLAGRGV